MWDCHGCGATSWLHFGKCVANSTQRTSAFRTGRNDWHYMTRISFISGRFLKRLVLSQHNYSKRRKSISRKRGFTKPWVLKKRISAAKSAENVAFGPKPSSSTQILRSGAGLGARPGLEPGPDPGLAGPRWGLLGTQNGPQNRPYFDPILTLFSHMAKKVPL